LESEALACAESVLPHCHSVTGSSATNRKLDFGGAVRVPNDLPGALSRQQGLVPPVLPTGLRTMGDRTYPSRDAARALRVTCVLMCGGALIAPKLWALSPVAGLPRPTPVTPPNTVLS